MRQSNLMNTSAQHVSWTQEIILSESHAWTRDCFDFALIKMDSSTRQEENDSKFQLWPYGTVESVVAEEYTASSRDETGEAPFRTCLLENDVKTHAPYSPEYILMLPHGAGEWLQRLEP